MPGKVDDDNDREPGDLPSPMQLFLPAGRPEKATMIPISSLERSADGLAALLTTSTESNGALRLAVLRWVLDLPAEIDPAEAAQILIGRQWRGEGAPFSDFARAMIAEMGRSDRARLAAFPRSRRRGAARTGPNESLPRQVQPLSLD
jgi:hypothetical protein